MAAAAGLKVGQHVLGHYLMTIEQRLGVVAEGLRERSLGGLSGVASGCLILARSAGLQVRGSNVFQRQGQQCIWRSGAAMCLGWFAWCSKSRAD